MELRHQTGGEARCEHLPALVGIEGALLTECVAEAGVRRGGREDGGDDVVYIVVGVTLELGRHDVGAEEGGFGRDLAGQAQAPHLVVDREPVPRLHLDGGGAAPPGLGAASEE